LGDDEVVIEEHRQASREGSAGANDVTATVRDESG
jgi:hypothetical protein